MVDLSLKEISSSQPMDVQNDKFNKHKSAQQIVNKEENIFYIIIIIINSLKYLNITNNLHLYIPIYKYTHRNTPTY
jgi:hypothetical protein